MTRILSQIAFLMLALLLSCSPPAKELKGEDAVQDVVSSETKEFNPEADYSISNIGKNNDYPASVSDTLMCKGWGLDEQGIKEIIGGMKAIQGGEWHHLFDHLPCQVVAELEQGGNKFDLAVNSGAWLTISSPDTTLTFGNFDEGNDKFFLSTVLTEEEN